MLSISGFVDDAMFSHNGSNTCTGLKLNYYVPLDTKHVMSGTFFLANLFV